MNSNDNKITSQKTLYTRKNKRQLLNNFIFIIQINMFVKLLKTLKKLRKINH